MMDEQNCRSKSLMKFGNISAKLFLKRSFLAALDSPKRPASVNRSSIMIITAPVMRVINCVHLKYFSVLAIVQFKTKFHVSYAKIFSGLHLFGNSAAFCKGLDAVSRAKPRRLVAGENFKAMAEGRATRELEGA